MKRESKTPFAILGILSQCEMNGYEIKQYIQSTIRFFWSESFGQIYPTLKKLLDEGLIRELEKKQASGKVKKVFKITKLGLKEFKTWMENSMIHSTKRDELLFKVFFARHMDKNIFSQQMDLEHRKNLENIASLKQFKKELDTEWKTHPDFKYWNLTLEYSEKQTNLNLEWIEKVKKILVD